MELNGIYEGTVIDNTGYQRNGSYIPGTALVKIHGVTPSRFGEVFNAIPTANTQGIMDIETARAYETPATIMYGVMGEGTKGKYNPTLDKNSASDVTTDTSSFGSSTPLNPPSAAYKIMDPKLRDRYSDGPSKHITAINNPDGNSYFPDHRYKAGKGVYAVPEPNAKVYVMFVRGSRSYPLIVGERRSTEEYNGYYGASNSGQRPNYPLAFQNIKKK